MHEQAETLSIGEMPLYWRARKRFSDTHPLIPARVNFSFKLDPALGLVRQGIDSKLLASLKLIYEEEYNVGYLQDGHMFSKGYGDDLINFIDRTIAGQSITSALEIGCGGCYLLQHLAHSGIDVVGVDPSPIAISKGAEKGIKVVPEFYPSTRAAGPFDLILHADVLEHVDDPVGFLSVQRNQLIEGGMVIISVPDCTRSIALGDVSMALHQHLNYFDEESLAHVVASAGLHVLAVERAKFGGSLYCSAIRKGSLAVAPTRRTVAGAGFICEARSQVDRFRADVDSLLKADRSVGFYMPLRAVPYLAHFPDFRSVRIFDDTPHWHGCYFDGVDVAVENFDDFCARPVDDLFIMSLTFGEIVRSKIEALGSRVKISTLPSWLDRAKPLARG